MGETFLAALSFEDRCVGGFERQRTVDSSTVGVFLDYAGDATPGTEASLAREQNWVRIQEIADSRDISVSRMRIDPYAMRSLEDTINYHGTLCDRLAVDLTCFTRPHVLAACQALAGLSAATRWRVGYTTPFSYGDLDTPSASGGWRDTLVLPLASDASLENEGLAVGIMLLGHQGERAAIALDQLEPAVGISVLTRRTDRPDIHRATLAQNRPLLEHLGRLRMPGPKRHEIAEYFASGGWSLESVKFDDLVPDVSRTLSPVMRSARALRAPIVLYPFGPKLVVFLYAFAMAAHYPRGSWAIYPVARTHPLNYSDGVDEVRWLDDTDVRLGLKELSA